MEVSRKVVVPLSAVTAVAFYGRRRSSVNRGAGPRIPRSHGLELVPQRNGPEREPGAGFASPGWLG